MPTPFGTLYTSNITPDPETGIGKWTADDFYRTMHTGRFPDGGLIYPAMPFASYTKVTRADSDAIFAYLRSIAPVNQTNKPHELRFPYNNRQLILGWRTLFFSEGEFKPDPTKSAEWNRGAYLVEGLGHCGMCHSPINALGGTSQSRGLQGRPDPDAELVRALAHVEPRGRPRRLEHQGHHRPAADRRLHARRGLRPDGRSRPQQPAISDRRRHPRDGGVPQEPRARPLAAAGELGAADHREQPADQPRQDRLRQAMRELPWRAGRRQAAALAAARQQPVDRDAVGGQPDPHGAQRRLSAGHQGQSDALRHAAVRAASSPTTRSPPSSPTSAPPGAIAARRSRRARPTSCAPPR